MKEILIYNFSFKGFVRYFEVGKDILIFCGL